MIIWYDRKIENSELGYTLYLDFKEDKEYWFDHNSQYLYPSECAGEVRFADLAIIKFNIVERKDG
tara:strand:- start:73 stop:267 length:195 start_codon:yes stop_codon:yes gene_type:complete